MKVVWLRFDADVAFHGYAKIARKIPWWINDHCRRWGKDYIKEADPRDPDYDKIVYFSPPSYYMLGKNDSSWNHRKDVIIHTMYDADYLPPKWVQILNRVDLVWVPSRWCKAVFERSGVQTPIVVSGYGVDPEEFAYRERSLDGPMQFLASGLSLFPVNDRKNLLTVLKAWHLANLPEDQTELVIKTAVGVSRLKLPQMKNVRYISRVMPVSEWANLVGKCDVFLCPTSGEGWGLPPMEAMATGALPVVTDYSSVREWMEGSPALRLRWKELVPAKRYNEVFGGNAQWAEPDLDHLVELIRWCFNNREEVIKRGKEGSEFIRKNYTWDMAACRAIRVLTRFYGISGNTLPAAD